ncbi:MAG: acetyl-CoA carboxylase biotin carboxyl carrier protein [Phycisphaerales bacterium]
MIDLSKLKELVALMSQNDLSEVALKDGDEQITIRRGGQPVMMMGAASPVQHVAQAASHAPVQAASASTVSSSSAPAGAGGSSSSSATASIDSPMVGTFYSKPNPDAKSFVSVGQSVSADSVVCIIEAMKVFNEIKAEKSGVIDAILVKDGQSVEFGQKLFAIK